VVGHAGQQVAHAFGDLAAAIVFAHALLDLGVTQNSTIVFPLPIDLLTAFMPQGRGGGSSS